MRNYGEELAYWYLRLNGFFLITNFVVHESDGITDNADCDLLGVRPPEVYEPVGGNETDWDVSLFDHLNLGKTMGVICEVKTGKYEARAVLPLERVRYALDRIGFDRAAHGETAQLLTEQAVVRIGELYEVATLVIAPRPPGDRPCIFISIDQARQFIEDRMLRYQEAKYSARHFFQSDLVQFIIYTNSLSQD